jgi:glycosyltransferase involved in cell wall biosynthesis
MSDPVKLAHIWSSDMGAVLSVPHMRHFQQMGWRITLMCPDGPRLPAVVGPGIDWIPLPLSRRPFDPRGDFASALAIARACRERRFDIVHTHTTKAGLIGRVMAGLEGHAAVVHTIHGIPFDAESPFASKLGHRSLEWTASRFADRILVQSREDRDTAMRLRIIAPERVVRIGNGIHLADFAPRSEMRIAARAALGLRDDDIAFFSAGRLVREKGFRELAAAAASARRRDRRIRLLVAGARDPEKPDSLAEPELEAARQAGVEWLGERGDMAALYAAADVVVLVSWREGLPRVLMEGAAMGKPLLASNVRGCREVVVPGKGGHLVPVRSPEPLAEAMLELAADGAAREAQGRFNRSRACEEYDLRQVITRIEAVYHQLLGS